MHVFSRLTSPSFCLFNTKTSKDAAHHCRESVAKSATAILGTAHVALVVGVDFLDLAPVPGLAIAGKTLLNIWDAVEKVDVNQASWIRLTKRCADTLLTVQSDVLAAGMQVADEIETPLQRLTDAFNRIESVLKNQRSQSRFKSYLKRDDIARELSELDQAVRDALTSFGLSIQLRTLMKIKAIEAKVLAEQASIVREVLPCSRADNFDSPDIDESEDLISLFRRAVMANSNTELLRVMQEAAKEMPQVVKPLQQALGTV